MNQLLHELIPIVAIISTIALPAGFGMFLGLTSIRANHKENMELIKQGIIPQPKTKAKGTPNRYRSLRNGILCIGIGIGAIVGLMTSNLLSIGDNPSVIIVMGAPILIFLGLAYVIFFCLTKNKNLGENNDESIKE